MRMSRVLATTLQVGYWLMYTALLFLFFLLLNAQRAPTLSLHNYASWALLMLISAVIPGAIAFYFAYLFAFNRFLHTKKIKQLVASSLLASFFSALVGSLLATVVISSSFWEVDGYSGAVFVLTILSLIALINFIMGLVIKGFVTWYDELQWKEELNRRNYEMELSLIKSQLDPHFLFNTINNIDVLISSDGKKASVYLNKLSEIMRFMLYETKTTQVPLTSELSYVEKYIDLQKIRTTHPENIRYSVESHAQGWVIEPMLFIPFIENAFKHFSNEGMIDVQFVILSNSIRFKCINTYDFHTGESKQGVGLGKELIERRLKLLYPDHHELDVTVDQNKYLVKLNLYR